METADRLSDLSASEDRGPLQRAAEGHFAAACKISAMLLEPLEDFLSDPLFNASQELFTHSAI